MKKTEIKVPESFRIPGTDIVLKEGETIEVREDTLEEAKVSVKNFLDKLSSSEIYRAMVSVEGSNSYVANIWKPKMLQDGNTVWLMKTKENGILIDTTSISSVEKTSNSEYLAKTNNGVVFHVLMR